MNAVTTHAKEVIFGFLQLFLRCFNKRFVFILHSTQRIEPTLSCECSKLLRICSEAPRWIGFSLAQLSEWHPVFTTCRDITTEMAFQEPPPRIGQAASATVPIRLQTNVLTM